jgi:hypothetical protein
MITLKVNDVETLSLSFTQKRMKGALTLRFGLEGFGDLRLEVKNNRIPSYCQMVQLAKAVVQLETTFANLHNRCPFLKDQNVVYFTRLAQTFWLPTDINP